MKVDLTDEKSEQIIEKYGLPTKLEENMPGWRDGNFLNDIVTRYFSNGAGKMVYFQRKDILWGKRNWEKLMMKLGKHLIWLYNGGKVFVEMLQFGLILGSILIICGVSTIFCRGKPDENAAINF